MTGCSDTEGGDGGGDEEAALAANARAAAVNVQLTDLPEGYVAIPPSNEEQGGSAILDGCVEDLDEVTVAEADSPTFQTDAGLRFVASQTAILSDPEAAERLLSSLQDPTVLECLSEDLGEVLAGILPGTTTETDLTLAPDPDLPDVGDRSVLLTGRAIFSREGAEVPVPFTASLAFIQTDEVLTVLLFGGITEPFPPDTRRDLTTAIADRQA